MKKKTLLVIFISLILIFQFVIQLYLAKTDSQTTDEGVHLSAGYTYLTKRDFRFNPEHPPLVKMLSATPLLFAKLNVPNDALYFDKAGDYFYDSWREARAYGEDFLYSLGNNADRMILLARMPMILLTILLGLVIFYISSKLWGTNGGVISLLLYVFEPLVLAHGHLVTTDIAVSFGYLASIYMLWLFCKKPIWRNVLLLGLIIGLAELTKFTAILIVPASIILLIFYSFQNKNSFKDFLKKIGKLMVAFMIALVVIWTGYMLKTATIPSASADYKLPFISVLNEKALFTNVKILAIPRDYYKGLSIVLGHTEFGHDSFLLGQHSKTGWWYYFPVLFTAKTAIPTLIFFTLSILLIIFNKTIRKKGLFLLIGALLFLIFSMFSKANLGVRHIMPFYVIFFVLAGSSYNFFKNIRVGKLALVGLFTWLIVEVYLIFPSFISYYNEFYGGTDNGYKIATDSNYDWGQDLKRISDYVLDKNLQNYVIEYSWDSDKALSYYGLSSRKYSPEDKVSRFVIINATALNNPPFDSLQNKPIYDRITPSVFLYEINKADAKQD